MARDDDIPTFYSWQIVAFGYTPQERIRREPTESELREAVVVIVRFRSLDDTEPERFVTIRHPVGFGVLPFRSLMEDLQDAVDMAADRYQIELVEG